MKQKESMISAGRRFFLRKENCMIIALAGVLLAVILIPAGGSRSTTGTERTTDTTVSSRLSSWRNQTDPEQVISYEERLTTLLEALEGVGRVRLMITERIGETGIQGIVVLADGAVNDDMKRKITDIVQALFPVEAHRIRVGKLKQ